MGITWASRVEATQTNEFGGVLSGKSYTDYFVVESFIDSR